MIPAKIKEIRSKLGISQEALARLIGVSLQTVSRWERGFFNPSQLAMEKIEKLEEKQNERR